MVDLVLHGCDRNLIYINHNIKLVMKHMAWIDKIFVLYDSDTEVYLKSIIKNKKIKTVHVNTFVPKRFQASYKNSCVVESRLHTIPGLGEYFLYACDDMFIGQPVKLTDFYLNEMPLVRFCPGNPNHGIDMNHRIPYVQMFSNAILNKGINYTRFQHNIQPFKKSLLVKYAKEYREDIERSGKNKVRSGKTDFNLLRIGSCIMVGKGDALLIVTNEKTDMFSESDDNMGIKMIQKIKPKFFCINNLHQRNEHVLGVLDKIIDS